MWLLVYLAVESPQLVKVNYLIPIPNALNLQDTLYMHTAQGHNVNDLFLMQTLFALTLESTNQPIIITVYGIIQYMYVWCMQEIYVANRLQT